MKVILEFPDEKAAFVLELLQHLPFVKTRPVGRRAAKPLDETEYLLSSRANRERLLAAMDGRD